MMMPARLAPYERMLSQLEQKGRRRALVPWSTPPQDVYLLP